MANQDLAFYSSENGDQWLLIEGPEGRWVGHQPNASSGGQARDSDLNDCLFREHNTPQGTALRRLLDNQAHDSSGDPIRVRE